MAKEINPTKMSIHEVLELVAKAPTKVEKSKVLKTYVTAVNLIVAFQYQS